MKRAEKSKSFLRLAFSLAPFTRTTRNGNSFVSYGCCSLFASSFSSQISLLFALVGAQTDLKRFPFRG